MPPVVLKVGLYYQENQHNLRDFQLHEKKVMKLSNIFLQHDFFQMRNFKLESPFENYRESESLWKQILEKGRVNNVTTHILLPPINFCMESKSYPQNDSGPSSLSKISHPWN